MNPSSELLTRVEKIIGSKPVSWTSINKGYTEAERYVMLFENGSSAFVKVATEKDTIKWLRDEYRIYSIIKADYIPKVLGWDDGEFPILILEDLSVGHWPPPWTDERIQKVLGVLKDLENMKVEGDFIPLSSVKAELSGWKEISKNPSGFLSLGLVDQKWLEDALPALMKAESEVVLKGDSLVHTDVRSDNVCFLGDKTYLIDWNWTVRGNPKFDIVTWLPSLHAEGGPPPWTFDIDEPALITAFTGFLANNAHKKNDSHKNWDAIQALRLKLLKSALPWTIKVLNLPEPTSN